MPFLDEDDPVALTDHKVEWTDDFAALADSLRQLELSSTGMIEHVGSTSIPGLVAKDVIDVQVRVPDLDAELMIGRFTDEGYRHRPEPWNNLEATRMGVYPKLVFAPAPGSRRANIRVRPHASPGAHDTLLFRDYLRADELARKRWDEFKRSLVQDNDVDFATYGQEKRDAWTQLMTEADSWALDHEWRPRPLVPWSTL